MVAGLLLVLEERWEAVEAGVWTWDLVREERRQVSSQ